jgi:hypothetical protein
MKLLPAASPKTLMVIGAILAAASLATFVVGLTLLGAGLAVPSEGGGPSRPCSAAGTAVRMQPASKTGVPSASTS